MSLDKNITLLKKVHEGINKINSSGELYVSSNFDRQLDEIMLKLEYLSKEIEESQKDKE